MICYQAKNPKKKEVDERLINAIEKLQKFIQEEENRKNGKKAKTISFAYASGLLYEKYLKGKKYGEVERQNGFKIFD